MTKIGLPSGVVTFVLSDVVGSTRLWEAAPSAMTVALARHDALIAEAVTAHGGRVLKARGEGDSTFSVFTRATEAVNAAWAAHTTLRAEAWPHDAPLSVRFAVHTGEAVERDGDYFGPAVNRAARLRGLAEGGDVLVSGATAALVADHLSAGLSLLSLGELALRDLDRPEPAFALRGAGLEAGQSETSSDFGVLGPLEVSTAGGSVIALVSEHQRLLLTMLLVAANTTVSADRLIDEMWPVGLPTESRGALRTQVSRLRRRLGSGPGSPIVTTDTGYRITIDRRQLDAARFEDLVADAQAAAPSRAIELLTEALKLWRGPAFAEFADRSFAQADAARLDELRITARERRAELLLEAGRVSEAAPDLEMLVLAEPHREHARALLMEARYRQGRHTEALDSYQDWRRHLADELGLEPSPELAAMEQRVLGHQVPSRGARPEAWPRPPRPASSFVGRQDEIEAAAAALSEARVVTLVGPGGVGKTRLALELVAAVADRYPGRVAFCDLSSVARGGDVARVVAAAVGVEERTGGRLEDQVVHQLGEVRGLLLVDNCEHVIEAATRLVRRIVEMTSGIVVLATSREPLAIPPERLFPLTPLGTDMGNSSAVRLFLDRARAADPGFAAAGDDPIVQSLCQQLDGLPLAIELAASRVRSMSIDGLSRALDRRFQLLVGSRQTDGRHQSLGAALDWSYELLEAKERDVFDRMAVFASWCDLDAAAAVAGDEVDVLRLVDCSLVVARRHGDHTSYSMLDTMRRYGLERLQQKDALTEARDRHAGWALGLAEDAAQALATGDEAAAAARIGRQFAEFRAANAWLVGRDPRLALRLVAALRPYALWRRQTEIGRWAEVSTSLVAGETPPALQAALLCVYAAAWQRGDDKVAHAAAQASAAAARDGLENTRFAVDIAADVAFIGGEVDAASRLHRRAYEMALADGDLLQAVWALTSVSHANTYGGRVVAGQEAADELRTLAAQTAAPSAWAAFHWAQGEVDTDRDLAVAQEHFEKAVELARSVGSRQVVIEAEYALAVVKGRRLDVGGALFHCEELLADSHATETSILPRDVVRIIELLIEAGAFGDAAVLTGAARSPRRGGAQRFPVAEAGLTAAIVTLEGTLGVERMTELAAEGRGLDERHMVVRALAAVRRALTQLGGTPGDTAPTPQ